MQLNLKKMCIVWYHSLYLAGWRCCCCLLSVSVLLETSFWLRCLWCSYLIMTYDRVCV